MQIQNVKLQAADEVQAVDEVQTAADEVQAVDEVQAADDSDGRLLIQQAYNLKFSISFSKYSLTLQQKSVYSLLDLQFYI